jgi:hypothetical protein
MRLAPPTPTLDDGIVALRPLSEGDRAGVARVFVTPDWVRWFGPGHDAAWAFSELGIARVQLWPEPDNLASQRVAIASGFTREGVLRHYDEIDGQRIDSVFFSRLPGDTSATRPRTL